MEGDDIVFVENVSYAIEETGAKTCPSSESTEHDGDPHAVTELPDRIKSGPSGLENDCPPPPPVCYIVAPVCYGKLTAEAAASTTSSAASRNAGLS
ncbi:hypothetical protein IG631_22668 [Alternaria alternata]|jgi:hypothetical protein|nr:hypothetical protein IG631_22668 [Alternaria alternata]